MTPPTRPSIGLALGSLLRADATAALRSRQTLILNLIVPLLYIVILGINDAKKHFATPGAVVGLGITLGLMAAGMLGYSMLVAADRTAGVFQRLRVTPTPTWLIMASRIIVQLVSAVVMSVVAIVAGSIVFGTTFPWPQILGAMGVSLLGAVMFLCLGQAIVALARSQGTVNAIGRLLYILLLLVGLLGASNLLGETLQHIAVWTPVGALAGLYDVVFGAAWSGDSTIAVIAVPVYAVVLGVVGVRFFRWDPR